MSKPELIRYEISPNLVASAASTETVILDYEAGKYFSLDEVGSFIWEKLKKDGPISLEQLCTEVTREYAVAEEECRKDLSALLLDLEKNGLIKKAFPEQV